MSGTKQVINEKLSKKIPKKREKRSNKANNAEKAESGVPSCLCNQYIPIQTPTENSRKYHVIGMKKLSRLIES